jgi:hypothetical protein
MDSSSKAQLVSPAVFKAIEDISKLSDIYETYTEDLKVNFCNYVCVFKLNLFFLKKDDWIRNSAD